MYGPKLPISQEIHALKHRGEGESFYESACRQAGTLADDEDHRQTLKNMFLEQRALLAGRVQAAVGAARRVTPFNCFVASTIPDSMEGIMDVAKEAAQTMRMGGGIGFDFSTIRPRGSRIISLDSEASGAVSFMEIYDAVCGTVSSAGNRRGAMMGVLRVDHPDIEEFIHAKQNSTKLRNFNISVGITDAFMEAVRNGDEFELNWNGHRPYRVVDAKSLWDQIMRATWEWAEPGVLFIDRINEMNNLHYIENIAATNPCLHPDTMIETTQGRMRIADMTEPTQVYCMHSHTNELTTAEASPSFISKRNANTITLKTDTGKTLTCTPDHKIWTIEAGWLEAQDLKLGDRIGHLCRTKKSEAYSRVKLNTQPNSQYVSEHRFVVSSKYDLKSWDDVHHIDGNTFNNTIDNLEVISHEQHSVITNTGADKSDMARNENTGKFVKIQDKKKRANIPMPEELRSNLINQFSGKIVSIEEGETVDVYDITVEDHHNFIANYLVVHNCAEQPLPPRGACLLASLNLVKYVSGGMETGFKFDWNKFRDDIPPLVRAVDNVIEGAIFPLPEQKEEAHNKRRIGLGVTGLANAGEAVTGEQYGSSKFLTFTTKVLKALRDEAYKASVELAKEKGPFPLFDKEKYLESAFIKTLPKEIQEDIGRYGIRNSHLLSIAPTGTISLAADNVSSGIEPVFRHEYQRTVLMPSGPVQETIRDYGLENFNVQGATADVLDISAHLSVLTTTQKYIDSAVSKTCNVGADVTWDEFQNIYMTAWEQGAKGCTTFRDAGSRDGIMKETEEGAACYYDADTGKKSCE